MTETAGARLRTILHAEPVARAASARDGLTGKLVEEAGFDAVWVSSLELSAARGLPDIGLLTMTECLQAASSIRASTSLPVLVDCDTGYGGTRNMVRAVREFETIGVAGICVEDKIFPKRNSLLDRGQILDDEKAFADRIAAAKQAQAERDFVLVARTEAFIAGAGLEEALSRARAYEAAGADSILVHSKLTTPEQIIEFARYWNSSTPVVIVPTTYSGWHASEAGEAGVSMMIYANHTLRASITATRTVLSHIIEQGRLTSTSGMAPMSDVFALTGANDWER